MNANRTLPAPAHPLTASELAAIQRRHASEDLDDYNRARRDRARLLATLAAVEAERDRLCLALEASEIGRLEEQRACVRTADEGREAVAELEAALGVARSAALTAALRIGQVEAERDEALVAASDMHAMLGRGVELFAGDDDKLAAIEAQHVRMRAALMLVPTATAEQIAHHVECLAADAKESHERFASGYVRAVIAADRATARADRLAAALADISRRASKSERFGDAWDRLEMIDRAARAALAAEAAPAAGEDGEEPKT